MTAVANRLAIDPYHTMTVTIGRHENGDGWVVDYSNGRTGGTLTVPHYPEAKGIAFAFLDACEFTSVVKEAK